MYDDDEMTPFERELVTAIRRLAHGGIEGPTGFEALTMAISGEGAPGRHSVGEGLESLAEVIRALDFSRIDVDTSIAELRGNNGENYVIGLVQGIDTVARAITEQANSRDRTNVITLMDRLGISFDADGGLSRGDTDRLGWAQHTVDTVAQAIRREGI